MDGVRWSDQRAGRTVVPALLILLLCLTMTGCSSVKYREVTADSSPVSEVDRYGVARADETYQLHVGDQLKIHFFYDPTLNQEVVIRPDGRVSLMLVDDLEAAGLTPGELDTRITEAYSEFFHEPEVTVMVLKVANAQVYVGGEVRHPSKIPIHGKMTAYQAIMTVGGFEKSAKVKQVLLVRRSAENTREIYELDLKESMTIEECLDDVYLQASDLLVVPKKNVSKVNQFVDQYIYGIIPLRVDVSFRYLFGGTYYTNTPE